MTKETFIDRIRKEYLKARKTIITDSKITRGTNHSISSISEDLFAKYISELISDDYEIWVDPQISVSNIRNNSGRRTKLFRPDVCVYNIVKKRVDLIFDLKMDLGYKRKEFIDFSIKRTKEICAIIQQEGTWKKNNTIINFSFNKSLKWFYVVLSEGNVTTAQMDIIKDYFKKNIKAKLFILSSGDHLNSYKKNPNTMIQEKSFKQIEVFVKKVCG